MPGSLKPFCIGSKFWPGMVKLNEECGELVQAIGKLMAMQEILESGSTIHFDGQTDIVQKLIEEMGDVLAAIEYVKQANKKTLRHEKIQARFLFKLERFSRWHVETRTAA